MTGEAEVGTSKVLCRKTGSVQALRQAVMPTADTQVVAAAGAASGSAAAESALSQLEVLLAKDQAPFSSTLHRLRAQLLLQLGRCRHMPASRRMHNLMLQSSMSSLCNSVTSYITWVALGQ